MKNNLLKFVIGGVALLVLLGSCSKKDPATNKLESLTFKSATYSISETDMELNLRKELVGTPAGIIDTAKISWKVSDENIATMEGSILVPLTSGDVKVTATAQGLNATCSVSITEIQINSIKLENITVPLNGTIVVKAIVDPENVPLKKFTWTSSDKSVATVDEAGVISGVKTGTATITATYGSLTSSCTATVKKINVDEIILSKSEIKFTEVGQKETITATVFPDNASYPTVTWSSSDKSVATVENGVVTCVSNGTAIITASADSKSASCSISFVSYVKDCEGNSYPIVKIGDQVWMAENLKCKTYDTESGRSGATIPEYVDGQDKYSPYYQDVTKKDNWDTDQYAGNLTDEQITKFGYLYNWSAAVGIATAAEAQTHESFGSKHQGICPNGWHIPTNADWDVLARAIGGVYHDKAETPRHEWGEYPNIGNKLKTVSGWYNNGNGTNDYGFDALPSGVSLDRVGECAYFTTASTSSDIDKSIISYYIYNNSSNFNNGSLSKTSFISVRCVQN